MKVSVICVGKLKEHYLSAAVAEYAKRLQRYCKLSIIELADEKTPDAAGEAIERQILQREGERILGALKPDMYIIALAIAGEALSSEQLAQKLERLAVKGESHLAFLIGGSLGLAPQVLQRANEALSFSKLTFPHQLMRVLVLEQLYRSYRITRGEPYHK